MKRRLSPRTLYAIVGGALLVYALLGWMVLVGPKRSEAAALKQQVEEAQGALAAARVASTRQDDAQPIAVADIFRLSTAMPAVPDMPGILLELSRMAQETGIDFNTITPGPSVVVGDYQSVPISVTFDGNFYELSDFLFRLRTLVGIRRSELQATGRLFSIQTIDFGQAPSGFPNISANLTINAFVYGTANPASQVPPPNDPAAAAEAPATPEAPAASGAEASGAGVSP